MDNATENESEETEKVEEAPEEEDYEIENVENEEEMESYEENESEETVHPGPLHSIPAILITDESESEEGSEVTQPTKEERRKAILKMKWATVTGKKPLAVPVTKRYKLTDEEDTKTDTFFGDRRPAEVERKRQENWMRLARLNQTSVVFTNEAKVFSEIRYPVIYSGLRCLRFFPDKENMVTAFGNGLIQIRKSDTGEVISLLKSDNVSDEFGIFALRFHPIQTNKLYTGGEAGIIDVYDVTTKEIIDSAIQEDNEITNLDLSPDGYLLATGGRNANLYIYDSVTLKLIRMYERPLIGPCTRARFEDYFHKMRIFAVKFHPSNSNIIVTGGWDNTVKVWDPREDKAVKSIKGVRICGDAVDVRETEILTASWTVENSLKLWDLKSGKLIKQISVLNRSRIIEGEFYYTAKFLTKETSDRDLIVAGGNGCGAVEVIDIQNDMVIGTFPSMKAVVALDSYDKVIAYGGMESVLRIGELMPQEIQGENP